ncbi:hypothetical protein BH23GEM9_BH23GEM9_31770 [soil metagenome]
MDPVKRAPALSVVLPTWDTFDALRTTVRHLQEQTVADSLELIICAPCAEHFTVEPAFTSGFHSVRVLQAGELHGTGPMRASAIREARADIIAFAEDHCYPEPGWAEALLTAHAEPHAAVGPAFDNANPGTLTSWADLYLGYGRWMTPGRRREVDVLPGHNTSYKRELLLAYGAELDRLMEAETVLLWDLRRQGHTLLFEPAARVAHTNFGRLRVLLHVQWHLGRVFGATRAEHWPALRRYAYAAATPAIPFIRMGHLLRATIRNGGSLTRVAATLPILFAALGVDFVAQATGALLGAGGSVAHLTAYEFHRDEVNRTGRPPGR